MVTLILSMPLIRKRLSWLVAGWLTVQLAALFSAPVVVLRAMSAGAGEAACDCPGAVPGQQCPMHRQDGGGHHETQQERCAMRGAFSQPDAVLLVLVIPGVVPQSRFVPYVRQHADALVAHQTIKASRSELPEFPPPRF